MTDDQIEDIKVQREVDKLDDLRIESVTLPTPGDESGEDAGGGDAAPPPAGQPEGGGDIDLADSDNFNKKSLEIIAEPNIPSLSLSDDSSPIKAQARVDSIASSLGLPISEEKKAEDKRYDNTKRRNSKTEFSDHLAMVQEDPEENNGKKDRYKEASRKKSDANPASEISRELRNASKMYESDGQFMNSFIDRKIDAQNRMSDRLRSTLKSLERNIHIKNKKTLLSEENEV